MASFGEELAFLKTQALSLRSIPVTFDNDYQPALQDLPKRVPIFPVPVAPPPSAAKKTPTSSAPSSDPSARGGIPIVVKSTKPALTFELTVHPTDTIAHIKSQLASQHPRAPLPDAQRLLIKGKVLADTKLLKEYPIDPNASTTITLMTKPGSPWTGEERSAVVPASPADAVGGGIVMTEPESFAQPSPSKLQPRMAGARGHGRSLSGEANSMPVPSLTLSPIPSPDGTAAGVTDLKLAMDLDLQPEPARSLTPKAEAFNQVITDCDFWTRLLEFLKAEFRTTDDASRAWEEFFLVSKSHLSPHQIAKIRDTTGLVSMAGN